MALYLPFFKYRFAAVVGLVAKDNARFLSTMNLRLTRQFASKQVHGAAKLAEPLRQLKHVYNETAIEFRTSRVFINLVKRQKAQSVAGPRIRPWQRLSWSHNSSRRSRVGIFGMPVTVVTPRPDCVLLATHQCNKSPNVELHHRANGYTCSGFCRTTDGQDLPPTQTRSVVATTRDWELKLQISIIVSESCRLPDTRSLSLEIGLRNFPRGYFDSAFRIRFHDETAFAFRLMPPKHWM